MNKAYLIFKHEFIHTIKKAGYIIMTLMVPVLALLGIWSVELGMSMISTPEQKAKSIGYVDSIGSFDYKIPNDTVDLVAYSSKADANQALADQEVAEYFVIPEDYPSTGTIQRFTIEKELVISPVTEAAIKRFMSVNLLKEQVSPEIISLVVSPLKLETARVNEEGVLAQEHNTIWNVVIPAVFSLLLGLALMFFSYSLITGLGEEKESRLIEVLFSSVSIRQLLTGKILALGAAGLLQVLIWLISAPLLLSMASSTFGGLMSQIQIPANFLIFGVIYFLLGYLLFAVLSVGVSGISSNAKEGGQLSLFYIMLGFVPLWLISLLLYLPKSPLWTILTIFPITAPVQTMLRLGVSDVPLWQIATSLGVLVASILLGLFISIKTFRVHMLMHGKKPGLSSIIRTLKES